MIFLHLQQWFHDHFVANCLKNFSCDSSMYLVTGKTSCRTSRHITPASVQGQVALETICSSGRCLWSWQRGWNKMIFSRSLPTQITLWFKRQTYLLVSLHLEVEVCGPSPPASPDLSVYLFQYPPGLFSPSPCSPTTELIHMLTFPHCQGFKSSSGKWKGLFRKSFCQANDHRI